MAAKQDDRVSTQQRLSEIAQQLEANSLVKLPIDPSELTHPSKMPPALMRALAFRVFESLIVFPDYVQVVMNVRRHLPPEERSFKLEKVRIKRAFRLPWWQVFIDTDTITPQSRLTVVYFNKSTLHDIYYQRDGEGYDDDCVSVRFLGDNEPLGRRRPLDRGYSLEEVYSDFFGERRKKQRIFMSSAFNVADFSPKEPLFYD